MRFFVFAKPAAGEIQYTYKQQPQQVNHPKGKAIPIGFEHSMRLKVNYLAGVVARCKE